MGGQLIVWCIFGDGVRPCGEICTSPTREVHAGSLLCPALRRRPWCVSHRYRITVIFQRYCMWCRRRGRFQVGQIGDHSAVLEVHSKGRARP